ncbi:MAG: hypothetical protein EBY21_04015 [Alphaproteobacteria bacterium]|nr:hypothetical protein [Alphaproteobacteria bacterium]
MMSHHRKIVLGLILASTTSLIGLAALAQQRGAEDRPGARPARPALSDEDRTAFQDARLAALRAGLRLTPDQDKLWPALETALRDMAKNRPDMQKPPAAEGPQAGTNPFLRLRERGEAERARGEAAVKMADAANPLWNSLTDEQKKRFPLLMRTMMGPSDHMAGPMMENPNMSRPDRRNDDMQRQGAPRRGDDADRRRRQRPERDDEMNPPDRAEPPAMDHGEDHNMQGRSDRRMPADGMRNRQERQDRPERQERQDRQERRDRPERSSERPEHRGEVPPPIFPIRSMGPVERIYP